MLNRKLTQLRRSLPDARERRVVFVSHCILNQNVRYLGGAGRSGTVDEVVGDLVADGLGIYQMPCPEQRAWGGVAKRHLLPMYGSRGTLRYRLRRPLTALLLWHTRWVYARLARGVARDMADHERSGVAVTGVLGVGPSPSCGVFRTLDVHRSLEVIAACPLAGANTRRFNADLLSSATVAGEGLFVRALRAALRRRGLNPTWFEHDLVAELRGWTGPVRASERGSMRGPVSGPVSGSVRRDAGVTVTGDRDPAGGG
ncbi:MAG TPA: hypothetical protein VL595_37450 [Pseudonocardia sp.]|nr:hypothetical protein [Pseudonocardia sp.]